MTKLTFGEIKEKLAKGTSYFHYDGTFWKERENVTGFYQTVRLNSGFTRLFFEGDAKLASWNKNCLTEKSGKRYLSVKFYHPLHLPGWKFITAIL
jgi:hypothetical protein